MDPDPKTNTDPYPVPRIRFFVFWQKFETNALYIELKEIFKILLNDNIRILLFSYFWCQTFH